MRRAPLKTWRFMPKAVVMPRWLRKLPPFNKLVYCERTYSNDYTSNTWAIVCMMRRESALVPRGLTKPVTAIMNDDVCRAVVYAGSSVQSTCLVVKTAFSPAFWMSVVRDAKHEFKFRK